MKTRTLLACVALATLCAAPISALAQTAAAPEPVRQAEPFGFDRGRNEGVAERARPDYDAKGLPLLDGAFRLRPELAVEANSESNLFYTAVGEQDDLSLALRPRLGLTSDWVRHSVRAEIGADDYKYQDFDSEDHTDVYAVGEARLDVRRGSYIAIGGRQDRTTERRGAPDSPAAIVKPIRVEYRSAYLAGVYAFNRFRGTLRLDRENANYKDAPLIGGGVAEQDDRDRTTTTATGRLEYAFSPDTALVAQVAANTREYELQPPRSALDRDSEGLAYLVGLNTDLTNLIRGEFIAGYLYQNYDDPLLKTAKGLALKANLQYFVTPLSTISLRASRTVEETQTATASSFAATDLEGRIDYEARRNVLLTAGLGGLKRDFEGINRNDDVTFADAGARFLLNRQLELGARWRYEKQDSSGAFADPDYDVNRFTLSAVARF